MVANHPVFELFVSGSSTGSDKLFHCMICQRDVSMESRGAAEFARHFFGKRHWELDVAYRVQNNLPVFNRLMDPMELSEAQLEAYANRPSKGRSEGFSFPEDLLPTCARVDSSVPLLTMVNCLLELCRCGGSYTLLRRLWGSFRATLGQENPLYKLSWDRAESLVSFFPLISMCLCHLLSFLIVVGIRYVSLTTYTCDVVCLVLVSALSCHISPCVAIPVCPSDCFQGLQSCVRGTG